MQNTHSHFYEGNPYGAMLWKLLLVFLLLLISQWLFYLLNTDLFRITSFPEFLWAFTGSMRFAVSAVIVYLSPYILLSILPLPVHHLKIHRNITNVFYYAGSILMLVINCIDIIYYRFTFRRMAADIFSYLGVGGDFTQLIPQFLHDYWFMVVLFAALLFPLFFFGKRIVVSHKSFRHIGLLHYVFFILFLGLSFLGWRGGIQLRPLSIPHASRYATAQNVPLVFNTPFSIYRTIGKTGVEEKQYFSTMASAEQYFNPVHRPHPIPLFDSLNRLPRVGNTNVVVVILESFSAEYTGIYRSGGESYTPFLDSLAKHSWVFRGMANGKRSIDGIPAVVASMPLLMNESYVTSPYGGNQLNSFAGLLKQEGYYTAFFHGGYNGSMGFDQFSKMVGFDHYFGKNEYPHQEDYDGNWGIFDLPYLQYMAAKLEAFPQPFATAVFTLSSHHPYTMEPGMENKFKKGPLPIHELVGYSDYALQEFFRTASRSEWFHHTLFVITADHTAQSTDPYYTGNVGMYEIPLMFYYPGMPPKEYTHTLAQQTDILPGIMDFLGYDKPLFSFGVSPFNTTLQSRFHVTYLNGEYQLIQDNYLLKFDGKQVLGLYDALKDWECKHDLKDQHSARCSSMEMLLKSIIQQYNHRLLANQLLP